MQMLDRLIGYGVYRVSTDRSHLEAGTPAVKFEVYQTGFDTPHVFTFSKKNHMSEEDMAQVMRSYLRKTSGMAALLGES